MSAAALSTPRPVTFSGIEKLSLTSRFSASRMDRTGGAARTAGEDGEEAVEVVAETVGNLAQMKSFWESMALPPVLTEAMEFGNCARKLGVPSMRYWPISAQEPSAATLTRGSGLGTATMT